MVNRGFKKILPLLAAVRVIAKTNTSPCIKGFEIRKGVLKKKRDVSSSPR
jgi:hypothetical protein